MSLGQACAARQSLDPWALRAEGALGCGHCPLVIGLDRSDAKADLCLVHTSTDQRTHQCLDTSPEALHHWLTQLRHDHPHARVAIALEQPALNLMAFLEPIDWISLYALNKAEP